jgi:DNA-binding transcriptional MerR regulator
VLGRHDRLVTYSAAQAARLSGCTVSQLRYWSRRGLVEPSGSDRRYTFVDLVGLRLVRSLLDAGLASARVGVALRTLRATDDDLASLRIVTDGVTVWACRDDGQILDALRSGQLALFVAVDRLAAQTEAEVHAFDAERNAFVGRLRGSGESGGDGRRAPAAGVEAAAPAHQR